VLPGWLGAAAITPAALFSLSREEKLGNARRPAAASDGVGHSSGDAERSEV